MIALLIGCCSVSIVFKYSEFYVRERKGAKAADTETEAPTIRF